MKKVISLLVLALVSIGLVACGGSSNPTTTTSTSSSSGAEGGEAASGGKANPSGGKQSGSSGGSETLKFEADPNGALAYTSSSATAKAGQVTVEFDNPQPLTHDVAIEDSNGKQVGKTDLIADDSTSTTVQLKPGTYTFYCTVPGHREAGMEGTLTVK